MHYSLHWLQAAADAKAVAESHPITYVDFLTVTLTALCVMLAALAIIIGVAAVWGYQQISSQAEARAEKAVGEQVAKLFEENNVKQMIRTKAEDVGDQVWKDMIAESGTSTGEDNRPVGDPYP